MSAEIRRLLEALRMEANLWDAAIPASQRPHQVASAKRDAAARVETLLLPALPPDDPPAYRQFVEKIAGFKICDDPGESSECYSESGPYCGKHNMFMEDTIEEARTLLGMEEKGTIRKKISKSADRPPLGTDA